jgi:hypothetical protein
MNQTALNFDAPRLPENPFSSNSQNYHVYEWIRNHGQIYLSELHHELKADTARIRDLRKVGIEIDCIRIREGETLYRVKTKGR